MSNNLEQIDLLDLIPSSISGDETIRAAVAALNDDLNQISRETRNLILFARINELEEPFLTHLAYQLKVEFWDDDLTDIEKRNLIKSSIAWHKIKGTPAAIEKIGGMVFGTVTLKEWYDYDGLPSRFKLRTSDVVSSASQYDRLFSLVDLAKNKRSVLEAVTLQKDKQGDIACGGVIRNSSRITIFTYSDYSVRSSSRTFGGTVRIASKKKILVHAFELKIESSSQTYTATAFRKVNKLKIGANQYV